MAPLANSGRLIVRDCASASLSLANGAPSQFDHVSNGLLWQLGEFHFGIDFQHAALHCCGSN
jgi:hypothetical protein